MENQGSSSINLEEARADLLYGNVPVNTSVVPKKKSRLKSFVVGGVISATAIISATTGSTPTIKDIVAEFDGLDFAYSFTVEYPAETKVRALLLRDKTKIIDETYVCPWSSDIPISGSRKIMKFYGEKTVSAGFYTFTISSLSYYGESVVYTLKKEI